MKIAFVNHGSILLPERGRALQSDSIGLWHYEVATRLARHAEVTVYSFRSENTGTTTERHRDVVFKSIAVGLDRKKHRAMAAWERLGGVLGRTHAPCLPRFASERYYGGFAQKVALDMRASGVDIAHVANFSQFVPHIRRLNPGLPIALHMHCEWLVQLEPGTVERRLRECDAVFGCSEFVTRGIQEAFPEHAQKCHPLLNGVDLERFAHPASGAGPAPSSPPYLLFVGRLSPEKGVHVLIEAFGELRQRFPELRLELVGPRLPAPHEFIVALDPNPLVRQLQRFYDGRGRPLYAEHLESLARRFEGIEFLGPKPQAELRELYQGASAFVFPSVWNEPFGMPIIEAMAAGVPVVTTRGGGIPEIVEHGSNGLLVAPGDAADLARALEELLANAGLGRRLAAAAEQRVRSALSWDQVADQLLVQLRHALDQRRERLLV